MSLEFLEKVVFSQFSFGFPLKFRDIDLLWSGEVKKRWRIPCVSRLFVNSPMITLIALVLLLQVWTINVLGTSPSVTPTRAPSRQPTGQPTTHIEDPLIRKGLVAYLPCSGSARDDSGNAIHGISRGGLSYTTDRFGVVSGACNFDGTSAYIELPQSPFNFRNNFTVSFWIKPSATQVSFSTLFDKSHWNTAAATAPGGWSIQQQGSTTNSYGLDYISPVGTENHGNYLSVTASVWSHLVIMKSGRYSVVYRNGAFVSRASLGTNYLLIAINKPLVIGAVNGGQGDPASVNGGYFRGIMDDIFFYNRTLVASEVRSLYQWQTPTSQPSTSPTGIFHSTLKLKLCF
jgi:hypothetical protein